MWKRDGLYLRLQYNVTLLTKQDLEEGLRLLEEKPIFTAKAEDGETVSFQKQNDVVMYRGLHNRNWFQINPHYITAFSNSELEAIIKARNS